LGQDRTDAAQAPGGGQSVHVAKIFSVCKTLSWLLPGQEQAVSLIACTGSVLDGLYRVALAGAAAAESRREEEHDHGRRRHGLTAAVERTRTPRPGERVLSR
jgi:hypothetical protein